MKFFILFSILTVSFSSQAAIKCSEENLRAILKSSGQLLGEFTIENIQKIRLVSDLNKKKLSTAQFKKEYYSITDKRIAANQEFLSNIDSIVKAHPECNEDSLFVKK